MVDILIVSNVNWDIKRTTKQSLLDYASGNRVILGVGEDFTIDKLKFPTVMHYVYY